MKQEKTRVTIKKLPLGIQNFPEIRRDRYVYIDKTPLALKLADSGKYYFLSRPGGSANPCFWIR